MHLKYLTGVHKAPVEYSIIIKEFGIEVIVIPHEVELCVRMAIVSSLHEVIHLVAEIVCVCVCVPFRNVLLESKALISIRIGVKRHPEDRERKVMMKLNAR